MKLPRTLLLCCLLAIPAVCVTPGCASSPSAQKAVGTTLLAIGAARDAAMQTAAQMLKDGRITPAQWLRIAEYHDNRFAPAYRLAVAAVKGDASALAGPDLQTLLGELLAAIGALQKTQ